MAAKKYPLTVDAGSVLRLALRYKDSSGEPVDLTGYTVELHRLAKTADAVPTSTHAGTTDASGNIAVTVLSAVTATWQPGPWAYRVALIDAEDEPEFLLVGPLQVRTAADV